MDPSIQIHQLETRADRFEQIDGDWFYIAHDKIRLWQIFITYFPESMWPSWLMKGDKYPKVFQQLSDAWREDVANWMMWKTNESHEFIQQLEKANIDYPGYWQAGKTFKKFYGSKYDLSIWPDGGGVQNSVDYPLSISFPLPDGLRVRLPKEAIDNARALGLLPFAVSNVPKFDVPKTNQGSSNWLLWTGLIGAGALAYVYRKKIFK